jgi:hypothetical protein
MEANVATAIKTSKTTLGRVPAALRIRVAVMTSNLVLESTAAMVNPPMSSMMVGENICEKMYFVASEADSRRSAESPDRMTRSRTTSIGTESDVTKRGIA